MPMPISVRLNRLALAMAATGLIVGSAAALNAWAGATPPARRPLPPLPTVTQQEAATYRPVATDGEAIRRPLFTPARRPQARPAVQAAGGSDSAPDLTVTGIISGGDVGAVAGVDKRTQKPFSLRAGESLGDWQIDTIDRNGLRLRHGGQVRDFPLQLPPSPPKAPKQP